MSSKGIKKRKTWRCDVCQIAVFDTYDEALDHEQSCQGNPEADIDALASAVARGREYAASANNDDGDDTEEEEEDLEERDAAMFAAVTGRNRGLCNNNDKGSPTVSTPTVLALLASSRAAAVNNQAAAVALPTVGLVPPASEPPTIILQDTADEPLKQQKQQQSTNASDKGEALPLTLPQNNDGIPSPFINKLTKWKCDYCYTVFDGYEEALTHENKCKKEVGGKSDDIIPSPFINKPTKWKCDYCYTLFDGYEEALTHENKCKKEVGGNKKITTDIHNSIHNGNNNDKPPPKPITNWKCDYCPLIFHSYNDAIQHENQCKQNKKERVPTTICIPSATTTNSADEDDDEEEEEDEPESSEHTTTNDTEELMEQEEEREEEEGKEQDAAVEESALVENAFPKNNDKESSSQLPSLLHLPQKRIKWKCDVCLVAVFESYDEALEHENQCKGLFHLDARHKKTKNDDAAAATVVVTVQDVEKEKGKVQGGEEEQQVPKVQNEQLLPSMVVAQQQPMTMEAGDSAQQVKPQEKQLGQLPKLQRPQHVLLVQEEKSPQKENGQGHMKAPKGMSPPRRVQEADVLEERNLGAAAVEKGNASVEEVLDKDKVVFLSLKDDFYRTQMFGYFRKLGASKQNQRNSEEEQKVKEEAYDSIKNSGRRLLRYHDWKRPDLGYVEVDDEYARRKISDDIRRRLDQKSLWEVAEDGEAAESSSTPSSKRVEEPKPSNVVATNNPAVDDEVQEKRVPQQPIAVEVVEKMVQQLEGQLSTAQQLKSKQPQMHLPISQQTQVQQPQTPEPTLQQPIVNSSLYDTVKVQQREVVQRTQEHRLIVQQKRVQQPQTTMKTIVQQPKAQLPRLPLSPPKMNEATKMLSIQTDEKNVVDRQQQIMFQDLRSLDFLLGMALKHHAGNAKYHEHASKNISLYQSAKPSEKHAIAEAVVDEWRAIGGRFLECDREKGCFTEVFDEKAIAKTKKILRAKPASPSKTATPVKTAVEHNADSAPRLESSNASRPNIPLPATSVPAPASTINTTANLNRSDNIDSSKTNSIIALSKETARHQVTPSTEQEHAAAQERRKTMRPFLKLVTLVVILLIAVMFCFPQLRKRGFEILFVPVVAVATLSLVLRLIGAYSSFALGAASITDRRGTRSTLRQVRLSPKAFVVPFLVLVVLIFVSVSLHLQHERVVMALFKSKVALMTLSPVLFFLLSSLAFAVAMVVTHEAQHHHIEAGFFSEVRTIFEDTFRRPPNPSIQSIEQGKCLPTLRDFLSHPDGFHMGFAPAFFGFFAYFGALAALEEGTGGLIVPPIAEKRKDFGGDSTSIGLRSVAGASAGAMAATLLACGIDPTAAAEFTSKFTWNMVADPFGIGGYIKGNKFEKAMVDFLLREASKSNRLDKKSDGPIQFEEALIPCAVTVFDLFRMKGKILSSGSMAKAARASAGFPGLFQPVAWSENSDDNKWLPDSLLIDGGIRDGLGLVGLGTFSSEKKRVVNLVVGDFGFQGPGGIHSLPKGVNASSLVSIAIIGTPMCGPWAMGNGKRAVESARKAMLMALDVPMEKGADANHYVLRVDASNYLT